MTSPSLYDNDELVDSFLKEYHAISQEGCKHIAQPWDHSVHFSPTVQGHCVADKPIQTVMQPELARVPVPNVTDSLFRKHNGTQHVCQKSGHDQDVQDLLPGTDDAMHLYGLPQKCVIGEIGVNLEQPWNQSCYDVAYNIDRSRIHPAAAQALDELPVARAQTMTKIIAYTDGTGGSFHDGDDGPQPAWASVLLGSDANGDIFFCGVLCAKVCDSGAFTDTLDKIDNNTAEFTAVLWTIIYAMQLPNTVALDIITDSDLTIGTAESVYRNTSNCDLAGLLTELWKTIAYMKYSTLFHVHSHQEDPYNELADSVAALTSRGEIETPMPYHIREKLKFHPAWQWLWLQYADAHTRDAYPTIRANAFEFSPCGLSSDGVTGPMQHFQHKEKVTKGPVQVSLALVTVNSRTLNPSGQMYFKNGVLLPTANDTGKAAAYRSQFIDSRKSIIGILEARSKQGTRHSKQMLVFASGACNGNWGCELHVNTLIPYATQSDKKWFFNARHFNVLVTEPTCLIVRVDAPKLCCHLCIAHAPHSKVKGGNDQIANWWANLTRRLRGFDDVILFIDANAHVGTVSSNHVGSLYAEPQDNCGAFFHDFLKDTNLWLPATFKFDGTCLDSKTYKNAHRNDYVALPVATTYTLTKSYNWHQFDMLNCGLDHTPTCLDVEYFIDKTNSNDSSWRDLSIDRQLLTNYDAVMHFKHLLLQIPLPEADALVDQHAEYNTRRIHQAMKTAFAVVPGRKAKSYLSDNTWCLVQLRRKATAAHQDTVNAIEKRYKITILRAWHLNATIPSCGGCDPIIPDADGYLWPLRRQAIRIHRFIDMSLPTAKACLKEDRDDFVASISRQIDSAPRQEKHNLAWKLIKPLQVTRKANLRFGCQKLSSPPKGSDGAPITDPNLLSGAKLDFFSQNEAAAQCTREELLETYFSKCNRRHDIRDGVAGAVISKIHNVPPLSDIVGSFAHASRSKGAGPDSIIDDLHFVAPHELARLWHPLYTKMALCIQEPLAFRGSLLVNFFKGKGEPGPFENDRVIYLGATPSKHYHKWMRSRAVTHVGDAIHDDQCAVKRNRTCIFTNHTVKCAQMYAHANNMSISVQFADIKSAFYKVVRQVVFERDPTDEDIAKLVARLQLPNDTMHALHRTLSTGWVPAVAQSDIDPHLRAILTEAHTLTWFVVEGADQIAVPSKGTGPGRPLADFVFALCYNSVLVRVKERMSTKGLTTHVTAVPYGLPEPTDNDKITVELADSTFADDTAFYTISPNALTCIDNAISTGCIIHQTMAEFGFEPNYDVGKTAVSFHFKGRNAKRAKQKVAFEYQFKMPLGIDDITVNVVDSYQHVGTVNDHNLSIASELANRCGGHSRSLGVIHKHIFKRSPGLDPTIKQVFVDSLANTKLLYSAETWPRLTPAQMARVDLALFQSQARVAGYRLADMHGQRLAHDIVTAQCDAPNAPSALTLCRLRYLPKVIRYAPSALRVLLTLISDVPTMFPSLIREDLQKMATFLPVKTRGQVHPSTEQHWFGVIGDSPAVFTSSVIKAHHACIAHSKDAAKLRIWSRTFNDSLARCSSPKYDHTSAQVAHVTHDAPLPNETRFLCYDCGYTCSTSKAWHKHRERDHGHIPPEAFAVPMHQTVCNACCKQFHTRVRLLWHLSHASPRCHDALNDFYGTRLTRAEALDAAVSDRLHAKEMRKQGRQKKLATLPCLTLHGPKLPPALEPSLRLADQVLPTIECVPELMPVMHPSTQCQGPFVKPTLYILHLFSGQRREGDIQYWIEHQLNKPLNKAYCVVVLSIDIVNDPIMGDLTRQDTLALWIKMFREGRVIGLIAGPPCETWTVARFMAVEGMRNPPPPLRSLSEIWGLPNLSKKHRQQVTIGNELLRATLILCVEAHTSGAFAIVEHPGEPTWVPEAPSIWRSTFVKHLQTHLAADCVDFDQCSTGADSKKPTCLMAINLPTLRTTLRALPAQGFCNHGRKAHKALKGLAEDGTWRTAPAKQYPSGMCESISQPVIDFIQMNVAQAEPGSRHDLPAGISSFYTPLDPYCAEHTLGAYGQDFAKSGNDSKAQNGRRRSTHKPWLLPQTVASSAPPMAVVLHDEPPGSPQNDPSLAYLQLTDAQIDRIARNRLRAQEIRRQKRLDWLHTFAQVTHISASPDRVEQLVRPAPRISSGATVRTRFFFGGKPKAPFQTDLAPMSHPQQSDVAPQSHLSTVQAIQSHLPSAAPPSLGPAPQRHPMMTDPASQSHHHPAELATQSHLPLPDRLASLCHPNVSHRKPCTATEWCRDSG